LPTDQENIFGPIEVRFGSARNRVMRNFSIICFLKFVLMGLFLPFTIIIQQLFFTRPKIDNASQYTNLNALFEVIKVSIFFLCFAD
jgi:hypothetical protein